MAFIRSIFGFIIALLLIAFAVANRETVSLIYSPLHDPVNAPLCVVALIFMALGFIMGSMLTWFNGGSIRKTKRQQKRKIKDLEKELHKLEIKNAANQNPPASELFPALTDSRALPAAKKAGINEG